jgi:hypothetical protein
MRFDEAFLPRPDMYVFAGSDGEVDMVVQTMAGKSTICYGTDVHPMQGFIRALYGDDIDYVVIEGCGEFKFDSMSELDYMKAKSKFCRGIVPSIKISKIIKNFTTTHGLQWDNTIGVDLNNCKDVDIARAYNYIASARINNSSTMFFIRCHDKDVIDVLMAWNQSPQLTSSCRDSTDSSCIMDVTEFFILSKCLFVIGSTSSKFSDEIVFYHRPHPSMKVYCGGPVMKKDEEPFGYSEFLELRTLFPDVSAINRL